MRTIIVSTLAILAFLAMTSEVAEVQIPATIVFAGIVFIAIRKEKKSTKKEDIQC